MQGSLPLVHSPRRCSARCSTFSLEKRAALFCIQKRVFTKFHGLCPHIIKLQNHCPGTSKICHTMEKKRNKYFLSIPRIVIIMVNQDIPYLHKFAFKGSVIQQSKTAVVLKSMPVQALSCEDGAPRKPASVSLTF